MRAKNIFRKLLLISTVRSQNTPAWRVFAVRTWSSSIFCWNSILQMIISRPKSRLHFWKKKLFPEKKNCMT